MTYRVRNIVIALGLALVAMMLTLFYVTNYKRSVQQSESDVQVYVAAHDVAAGVTGAQLVKQHALQPVQVAKRTVVAGSISSPDQIERLVLSQPLYQGEQVTLRRFSDTAALGIRAQLRGTARGFQISGDANQLLAGTLRTGDHVDLVTYIKDTDVSRIVLRDIPVLQASGQATTAKVDPNQATSVILSVTDTQVQRLLYALRNTDWSLELRPVVDAADSPERADNTRTESRDGIGDAEWYRVNTKGAH